MTSPRRMPTAVRTRRTDPETHRGRPRGRAPRRPSETAPSRGPRAGWWLAFAAVILVVGAAAVLRASFFSVQHVQLTGEARTSAGAVEAALAIEPGQALATVDTGAAERRVAELPWVETVDVTRRWPSTLRVKIREHAPAAVLTDESASGWLVLGRGAQALERRLTPLVGLPVILVPKSMVQEAAIGEVVDESIDGLKIALELPSQLEPWVDSWVIDAEGSVSAELRGSARALFGEAGDNRTQYVSLASILGGDVPRACVRTIDLRIPDTPVVHRDRDCLLTARSL